MHSENKESHNTSNTCEANSYGVLADDIDNESIYNNYNIFIDNGINIESNMKVKIVNDNENSSFECMST